MEMNLFSAVRATRAAVPHLIERATSTIVTVCSVNASLPDPGVIDYSAAKAALRRRRRDRSAGTSDRSGRRHRDRAIHPPR
jgi:NAD(P)-dependent dehydrogenase (short-subunit alcohol dehydrogenase family)